MTKRNLGPSGALFPLPAAIVAAGEGARIDACAVARIAPVASDPRPCWSPSTAPIGPPGRSDGPGPTRPTCPGPPTRGPGLLRHRVGERAGEVRRLGLDPPPQLGARGAHHRRVSLRPGLPGGPGAGDRRLDPLLRGDRRGLGGRVGPGPGGPGRPGPHGPPGLRGGDPGVPADRREIGRVSRMGRPSGTPAATGRTEPPPPAGAPPNPPPPRGASRAPALRGHPSRRAEGEVVAAATGSPSRGAPPPSSRAPGRACMHIRTGFPHASPRSPRRIVVGSRNR
jgi:hypothetical protein